MNSESRKISDIFDIEAISNAIMQEGVKRVINAINVIIIVGSVAIPRFNAR